MCIRILWRSEKCIRFLRRSEQLHQEFMKAWKCIRILWRSENKMHHDFMKVWKMHQDFMKVWKNASRFYEGLKNQHKIHLHAASASTTCIMILWRSENSHLHFVSPFNVCSRSPTAACCTSQLVGGVHNVRKAWDCRRISHGGEQSLRRSAIVAVFAEALVKSWCRFLRSS